MTYFVSNAFNIIRFINFYLTYIYKFINTFYIKNKNGCTKKNNNARFFNPLDTDIIKKNIEKTKKIITLEDGIIINGVAIAVKELIIDNKIETSYAYPDQFI